MKWSEVNEKEKKTNAASDPIQNLEYIFQYKIHYIIPNSLQIKNQLHIKIPFTINWTSVFLPFNCLEGEGFLNFETLLAQELQMLQDLLA